MAPPAACPTVRLLQQPARLSGEPTDHFFQLSSPQLPVAFSFQHVQQKKSTIIRCSFWVSVLLLLEIINFFLVSLELRHHLDLEINLTQELKSGN